MRLLLSSVFAILTQSGLAQMSSYDIRDLKGGRVKEDTSHIYWLPYAEGKRFLIAQAANSKFLSHKGELSLDFKMKIGSTICAARSGTVIAVKEDSQIGGVDNQYLSQGNHIIILHIDGSLAKYWHLQYNGVVVESGDTVAQGQVIGYSGNTGYTAFPHLHFQVVNNEGRQVLIRFVTKKGVRYPRPGRSYRSVRG
jgi:murein DD-endopeptidase MepM/ murein hydrolase activator NlpD